MEYRDRPVWIDAPNFVEALNHGQLDDASYDAPTGGAGIPWKVTSGPKRTLTLPFVISDYEDMKRWRAWWAGREGRRRGFWVPTWLTDYVAIQDYAAGVLSIRVKFTGVGNKVAFGVQFRHIAMITQAGKMEFYRIDATAMVGADEELTLDHVLESNLVARNTVICGLLYARLADDEIEYEYVAGNVAHVDLKFVELPKETESADNDGEKPAWLYVIQQGPAVWRFTTYPINRTVSALVYSAAAIEHGEITEDIEFNAETFSLSVATDDAAHPIRQFLDPTFVMLTTLSIYELADAGADPLTLPAAPIYKGRIEGATFRDKGTIDVKVSTLMRISEIDTPQALSERTCVHETYDEFCGLSALAFTTTGTITAKNSSPPWIEAAAFGAKATAEADPNWFALGIVTVGAEQRFCTKQVGTRLFLNAPFRDAIVGDSADALAGDDKRIETCDGKFDNVTANAKGFLGFPWMPNKNPQFEALEAPKPKGGKK